jgi:hypothetical protein
MPSYNGWKNYQTWNAALWIGNDEGLYSMAKEIAERHVGENHHYEEGPYRDFAGQMRELGSTETNDKVAWNDSSLDIQALDEMMYELVGADEDGNREGDDDE